MSQREQRTLLSYYRHMSNYAYLTGAHHQVINFIDTYRRTIYHNNVLKKLEMIGPEILPVVYIKANAHP